MESRKHTTCRNCGADVRWVFTNNGKRTLLDAEPADAGTVAIVMIPTYEAGAIELAVALRDNDDDRGTDLLDQARRGGVQLRTVHFLTCSKRQA